MNELAGLEVLVLRSPQTDDPLVAGLIAKGAKVHSLPVQKIAVFSEPRCLESAPATERPGKDTYHKAVFVSRRAASLALSSPGKFLDALKAVDRCFAVGPTTAAVIENQGLVVSYPDNEWNSEGLLALPELGQVSGERIIIFRGRGGRELLGQALRERGARVDYCELYERKIDTGNGQKIVDLLRSGSPCVLVAHSGEILVDLLAVIGSEHHQRAIDTPLVVPGARLAKRGRWLGFKRLIVAESAQAAALERALLGWYTPA